MNVKLGQIVPITLQVEDGNELLFPQAYVRDNNENLLTTIDLVHNVNGEYIPSSDYYMPNFTFIKVQYRAFDDAGHTTPAEYEIDLDVFIKEDINDIWETDVVNGGFDGGSAGSLLKNIPRLINRKSDV